MKGPDTMRATQEEFKHLTATFPSRVGDCYWLVHTFGMRQWAQPDMIENYLDFLRREIQTV